MKSLVAPIIHINGTDGQELLFQTQRVMTSLAQAQDALRLAMPNARDYYLLGDETITDARAAFSERYKALSEMLCEFEQLAMAIDSQIDARNDGRMT